MQRLTPILPVRAEDAGEALLTVKGYPGKLAAVVVEEARGKADTAARRNVGKRCLMVGTVEIFESPGGDEAVLDGS